jgi:hypothetical protein
MTTQGLEAKAEEIARALKAALPGEPPRALAVLCLRVATLLRLEADRPAPYVPRKAFRLQDNPGCRGTIHPEPRVYRCGLR